MQAPTISLKMTEQTMTPSDVPPTPDVPEITFTEMKEGLAVPLSGVEHIPAFWDILPGEGDTINCRCTTGRTFTGTRKEFTNLLFG